MATEPEELKATLPFRVRKGAPLRQIEYEEQISTPAGPRTVLLVVLEGHSIFGSLFKLLNMYWELEADYWRVRRERDLIRDELRSLSQTPELDLRQENVQRESAKQEARGRTKSK